MHHDIPCHYCKRFGKESTLEHLPAKKSFYCKLCGNYWGEDSINEMRPKKAPKKEVVPAVVEKEPKSVDAKKLISKKA